MPDTEERRDEPTVLHPVVRKLEEEAIALYRAKYPDGPLWQELDGSTQHMWVAHAERQRASISKEESRG